MRRIAMIWLLALALGLSAVARAEAWHIDRRNEQGFTALLYQLMAAYEEPSDGDGEAIDRLVDGIGAVNASDGALARAIAGHWKAVYLDPEYRLFLYDGGETAEALSQTGIPDSATHAFVVLGYELRDGKMTRELKGRCDAAAAAAKAFPNSIMVCSGGATGKHNPDKHTEAGLMKQYLAGERGIDPSRIHIDERAMTTLENAVNTLEILRQQGVQTFTLVTSGYHQRWGQVLYNAMAAIYGQSYGYEPRIVGNYCFDIEPSDERYRRDDRIALKQLASMLDLPEGR